MCLSRLPGRKLFRLLNRISAYSALGLVSACAVFTGSSPEETRSDLIQYSASVFAMDLAEQEAASTIAMRNHEAEQSSDSALRLAIVTISLAQAISDLRDARALVEFAADQQDAATDPAFVSLLGALVEHLIEREGALDQERQEKLDLRQQLDALRQLEQELATQ